MMRLQGPDLVRDPASAFFDMFFNWRVVLPSSDPVAADGVKQELGDKKKRRARTRAPRQERRLEARKKKAPFFILRRCERDPLSRGFSCKTK